MIIRWKRISFFAEIRWGISGKEITLTCDKPVQRWHESALVGLLSHELSHPCVPIGRRAEERTDVDVIDRGLGVYLAAERLTTGRYLDQVTGRGKDRYLGYQSVRERLTGHETRQLDRLLDDLRIVPSSHALFSAKTIHDLAIRGENQASVGGYVFQGVSIPQESSVKLLIRGESVFLFVDDQLVGETLVDQSDCS
jgi:hypothetical protein